MASIESSLLHRSNTHADSHAEGRAIGSPRRRPCLAWIATLAALEFTPCALADQTEAEKRTEAEAIFAQAKDLMAKKDFASACPKLEEVVGLQPMGIGAKMSLADCYIGAGKLASAHAILGEAASLAAQANQPDRASSAQDRAQSLEPRLSKLTISIPADLAKMPGLAVTRDGSPVSASLFNVTVPVDGGAHVVSATIPHMKAFEKKVDVPQEGGSITIDVTVAPEGTAAAAPPAGDATTATNPLASPTSPAVRTTAILRDSEPASRGSFWSPIRIGGFAIAGVGLATIGAGVGVGVSGAAKTGTAAAAYDAAKTKANVTGENTALADHASAHNQAVGGWVTAGIGGGALIAGVVMIAVAPKTHGAAAAMRRVFVAPLVGRETQGLSVAGAF